MVSSGRNRAEVGRHGHIPALRALSETFEIVGVANASRASAEAAAAEIGLPRAFDDVAELIASQEVDIIKVAVKVQHHLEDCFLGAHAMRWTNFLVGLCVAVSCVAPLKAGGAEVMRTDFYVESDPTIYLAVREVTAPNVRPAGPPVILIHGARVPGIASFDLNVRNGSLAVELATAGLRVFVMDARGYGGSTRTAQDGDPAGRPPLARSDEIVRDIGAVARDVRKRTSAHQVALFGWATGGHWAGMFASRYPEAVSHLAILNSLYGGHAGHPTLGPGGQLTDPSDPSRLDGSKVGAFGFSTAASLGPAWDASIPAEDKTVWRDLAVLNAYEAAALASDPTSSARNPPSFRAPMGAMADSFELASGRKLWDASSITARVLLLRSEYDFWSRAEDLTDLARDLIHARSVKAETLVGATHYVHLDRAEHGRDALVKELISFLTNACYRNE